jgi:hypothetical protein
MFDELGMCDVIDQATHQNSEMRIVTAGTAGKARVPNGLGLVNQPRYRVPHFFQNKPTARLFASCIEAKHLNDDALGRAFNTLYAHGAVAHHRRHLDGLSFQSLTGNLPFCGWLSFQRCIFRLLAPNARASPPRASKRRRNIGDMSVSYPIKLWHANRFFIFERPQSIS